MAELLFDNDIVYELAQMDMLDEAVAALKVDHKDIWVLSTLRFQVTASRMKKRLGNDNCAKIIKFVDGVNQCEAVVSTRLASALDDDGIDIGELQLLQALLDSSNSAMYTGDKRFLNTLAALPILANELEQLQGRFICFEQIVLLLIDHCGFAPVRDAVVNAIQQSGGKWDASVRICFTGLQQAKNANVRDGLNSYIADLRSKTKGLV